LHALSVIVERLVLIDFCCVMFAALAGNAILTLTKVGLVIICYKWEILLLFVTHH